MISLPELDEARAGEGRSEGRGLTVGSPLQASNLEGAFTEELRDVFWGGRPPS